MSGTERNLVLAEGHKQTLLAAQPQAVSIPPDPRLVLRVTMSKARSSAFFYPSTALLVSLQDTRFLSKAISKRFF